MKSKEWKSLKNKAMRVFVWAMLSCFLVSCQEPKNKFNQENNSIIGTWDLIKSKSGNGSEMMTTTDFDYSIRFKNDGKYRDFTNGKGFSGIYSINKNDILEMINPVTKDTLWYSYQIENSKLILNKTDKLGNLLCDEGCTEEYEKVND